MNRHKHKICHNMHEFIELGVSPRSKSWGNTCRLHFSSFTQYAFMEAPEEKAKSFLLKYVELQVNSFHLVHLVQTAVSSPPHLMVIPDAIKAHIKSYSCYDYAECAHGVTKLILSKFHLSPLFLCTLHVHVYLSTRRNCARSFGALLGSVSASPRHLLKVSNVSGLM